jgi:uncharacterized protein
MDNDQPYQIPLHGRQLIYMPRRRLAFFGNDALAAYLVKRQGTPGGDQLNPQIEQFLDDVGYDRPALECPTAEIAEDDPHPTNAVLLMTNRCNLRCVYCYANAGSESRLVEIPWPTAQTVIDFVAANAMRENSEPPSLTFHGGGEPTMHWDLLIRCVEYAREKNPHTRISMSSNGVWKPEQRRFVCERFQNVSLSMDGLPAIQNDQRPCAGGGESFPAVLESIHALDAAGIDYGIRMTILPESVEQLPESVRFLCESTKARAIQIEPTFTSSRGHYADIDVVFADRFVDRFMEAWRIGRQTGRTVYYSGARPLVVASLFCQAPLKAAVATADGRLVTCFEVFSEQSPLAGGFTVGRVLDGRVVYDRGALQAFLDAQQRRRRECEDCFCYWHCCGDCATRRPGPREASLGRCRVTRNVTLAMLMAFMEDGGGIWQGLREIPGRISGCDIVAEKSPHAPAIVGGGENL